MRSLIFALALIPAASFAQEAEAPSDTMTQSCPSGMIWSMDANACTVAAEDTSPAQSMPGGSGCSGSHGTARSVTS